MTRRYFRKCWAAFTESLLWPHPFGLLQARAASGHAGATLAKDQRGGSGTKGVRYAHFTDQ